METSLYDKYGGFGSVNRVVMAFYDRLLDSDELGPYFDDIDLKGLIDHQTKFISSLLGGPASFTDDHLTRAHARLNVTEAHFDEMKLVLGETLAEHGFAPQDIETVLGVVEGKRPTVVPG